MIVADRIKVLTGEVIARKTRRDMLTEEAGRLTTEEAIEHKAHDTATEARNIVAGVLAATQEKAKSFLEEVTTLALTTVYGDDYEFRLDFVVKRNQAEATPVVVFRGKELSPREEVGGGVVDVVAFALRLGMWSLTTPSTRATFLLDEPFRYVSKDKLPRVGMLLKEVSSLLGVQIIMVSHEDELADLADKAYVVRLKQGTSVVRRIKQDE